MSRGKEIVPPETSRLDRVFEVVLGEDVLKDSCPLPRRYATVLQEAPLVSWHVFPRQKRFLLCYWLSIDRSPRDIEKIFLSLEFRACRPTPSRAMFLDPTVRQAMELLSHAKSRPICSVDQPQAPPQPDDFLGQKHN